MQIMRQALQVFHADCTANDVEYEEYVNIRLLM